MNLRTMIRPRARRERSTGAHRRPPNTSRRPALYLSAAAAGALMVNVIASGEPAAQADGTSLESVSIAEQLGIQGGGGADAASAIIGEDAAHSLGQLAASRAERSAEQTAAAQAQAAANLAEQQRREALIASRTELARRAAEAEAARAAAEEAAAAAAAAEAEAAAATAVPSGSYQDYALAQLGGDANEFSCLENLWGKESGWNPDAQNPTSTAYGIPQFLDSTWAGTGIAKTSDGYRQIDAGLIYIEQRYGSPCSAWAHSQANNWY